MYRQLSDALSPDEQAELSRMIREDQEVKRDWVIFLAEQYLDKELTEGKYKLYLADFPQLEAEVQQQKEVRSLWQEAENELFKSELKEILPPLSQTSGSKMRPLPLLQRKWVYALAAAILLLLCLPFVFQSGSAQWEGKDVFAQNFQQFDMRLNTIRGGDETDSLKFLIQSQYQSGEYAKSIPLLQQLIAQEPENPSYKLYLGICYMGKPAPQPQDAIAIFKALQDDLNFGQAAEWYLSLAYFLDDNVEEGKRLAEKIGQHQGHSFRTQATKLLSN